MSECKRTRDLCRALERCNAMTYPLVANKFAPPGWPDRYVHHKLWQGLLEFKEDDGALRPDQVVRIRELNARAPGSAFVIRFAGGWLVVENHAGEAYSHLLCPNHCGEGAAHRLLECLCGLTIKLRT